MNVWEEIGKLWSDPVGFSLTVVAICTVIAFVVVYAINQLYRFLSWLFTTPPPQADLVKALLSYFEEDREWVWDQKQQTLTYDKMVLYVCYNSFDKTWILNQVDVDGKGFNHTSFIKSDWNHVSEAASEMVSDYFIEVNRKREKEALVHLQHVPTADSMLGMLKRIEELEKKITS